MNTMRKALTSPGAISGSVTVVNVVHGEARSVCAASSRLGLMPSTTPTRTR